MVLGRLKYTKCSEGAYKTARYTKFWFIVQQFKALGRRSFVYRRGGGQNSKNCVICYWRSTLRTTL